MVQVAWNWGWITVTYPLEFDEAQKALDVFLVHNKARLWQVGVGPVDV